MKTYAVIFTFVPNAVERRQPYRQAHLEYIGGLRDAGRIVMSGPWADPLDGALMVFRAESLFDVEKIIRDDPYYQANLWPEIRIREWNVVMSSQAAFIAITTENSAGS